MADPQYSEALVVYIDILGFREMIKDSERNPSQVAGLRNALKVLKKQIGTGLRYSRHSLTEEHSPKKLFRAFSFSDLTVRATILESADDLLYYFGYEMFPLVISQCLLACRDDANSPLLLRGGVTMGSIDVHPNDPEEDFLFGPALVRAYDLENKTAIFPRIVVDPKVIRKMAAQSSGQYEAGARAAWGVSPKQLVRLSEDGVYFVDYLNACEDFSYVGFDLLRNRDMSLTVHKHMIEAQIEKLKRDRAREGVIQKYLWLANYHNSKVDELPSEPDEDEQKEIRRLNRQELYISEELLNLLK